MRASVDRKAFLAALALASARVDKRSTNPVLQQVLLTGHDGKLLVRAQDLNIAVTVEVSADIQKGGGQTVDPGPLAKLLKELDQERVSLETSDKFHLEVKAGKSRYRIAGLDARDFPRFPTQRAAGLDVPTPSLQRLIECTAPTIAADEAKRPGLSSLYLRAVGGVQQATATNGHALNRGAVEGVVSQKTILVPRAAVLALQGFLDSSQPIVKVAVEDLWMFAVQGSRTIALKLHDPSIFPEAVDQLIQPPKGAVAEFDLLAFRAALRRVLTVVPEDRGVYMTLAGETMALKAQEADGEGEEELPLSWTGPRMEFLISAGLVSRSIAPLIGKRCKLETQGDVLAPIIFRADGDQAFTLVAPMRG